ncbi:MAG TPA: hypothetical protein VHX63_07660 [Acidobacteriaceae bacterium]|jgi:hypothetical protein|nr:hypothetical protein [Acidobacteriaceae bacterium]
MDPLNPFPLGARTGKHNIALSYLPGPGEPTTYRRRSFMTIRQESSMTTQRTDAEKRDTSRSTGSPVLDTLGT